MSSAGAESKGIAKSVVKGRRESALPDDKKFMNFVPDT